jgi:predicted TIM-barrel fold metal-dependent hydrolase
MKTAELEKQLIAALEEFEIIDCHEHLSPEKKRLERKVDVFTLFAHYTEGDLNRAGMSTPEFDALFNHDIPLERRWASFEPYWEQIRWTSYSKAALIAAKRFYVCDDINAKTYQQISRSIQDANKPGIYERVLKGACNIRTALTQCGLTQLDTPLLTPVMYLEHSMRTWEEVAHPIFEPDAVIRNLDDYLDAVRRYVLRVKSEGAVGLKLFLKPYDEPNRKNAIEAFEHLKNGTADPGELKAIRDYVADEAIAFAAKQDLVIAVHAGYWGDFRDLDPLHLIPILQRYPEARFDVYHLGYPWVRETLMLGKGFSNVWLNFCWTHIISQKFATEALDEAIDLIPANKLLAFGGDYGLPVEKVYGHLTMARQDIAKVLANRIVENQMTEDQALELARRWFWDNPKELYRLKV